MHMYDVIFAQIICIYSFNHLDRDKVSSPVELKSQNDGIIVFKFLKNCIITK